MSSDRFTFEEGLDCRITLDIDKSIMTAEMASAVVNFWSGAREVMDAANGDVFEAVARFAAGRLFHYLLDGYTEDGAVAELQEQEGWPVNTGITIVYSEYPSFDPVMFDLVEKEVACAT